MTDVMKGVRILEVAEHTFVPAASAIMADWGAEVIKVEHFERGDAMRGLGQTGVIDLSKGVHVLLEHSNRGKRSIGIDLANPQGLQVLYELAKTCDVFLSNKLPRVLAQLKIDVEDIRAQNPDIIYVRGTSFGPRGEERDKGGYDMSAFWCRGGSSDSITSPDAAAAIPQPGPAYGDSLGGMAIAGGISAALFKRERTGKPSIVDVSLLATGAWAMSPAIALSLQAGHPYSVAAATRDRGPARGNPLTSLYRTADQRFISLVMLQGFHYWPDFCRHIGRQDLVEDERFNSAEKLGTNYAEAMQVIQDVIATKTLPEWTAQFQTLKGQWAPVQNTLEVAADPQVRANGYMATAVTKDGTEFELVSAPVQFDEEPTPTARAPEFNEHCDEILRQLGMDDERIIELKIAGAVT